METIEIKLGTAALTRAIAQYGLTCIVELGDRDLMTTIRIPAEDAKNFRRPEDKKIDRNFPRD